MSNISEIKVIIGARVPPRTSMFEHRDHNGGYRHTFPPMTKDGELLQAALLAKASVKGKGLLRRLFDWVTVAEE